MQGNLQLMYEVALTELQELEQRVIGYRTLYIQTLEELNNLKNLNKTEDKNTSLNEE